MWEQIRSNQVRSIMLAMLMGILLLAIGYFLGYYFVDNPVFGLIVAFIVWGILALITFTQGDSIILGMSGARKIGPQDHPQLYNVVEEMKIASGLEAMPNVYIIDDPALNAFSTGRNPQRASVAITSGLLNKLNRDELQGVIGHEIGHIRNRDILLMLVTTVMMGSIILIAYFASRLMFYGGMSGGNRRRGSSGGGGAALILLLIGLVFMILAPIVAQIIYFAISRRREYLADASSALYTRYPEGLASALEKLEGANTQVKTANKATAPLFISNPFYRGGMQVTDLFATHPPLPDRIRILRAMEGASYRDYERAYEQQKKSGVIPASELGSAPAVGLRAASAQQAIGTEGSELDDRIQRTRQTEDLMWRMGNFKTINCENCGTRLRLPPQYDSPLVRCPHCGHINKV